MSAVHMKVANWQAGKTVVRPATLLPQSEGGAAGDNTNDDDETLISVPLSSPEAPVFELVPLEVLPAFDAAKTPKSMLLTPIQIRQLNLFRRKWRHVTSISLQIGNLLMLLTTMVPRRVGSVTAVLSPLLQFPGMLFIMASIRIEMLYLLFGTYDFWYFTGNNILFGLSFAAMLNDIRIVVVVFGCVIVQTSIGADALVGDRYNLFLSSLLNCVTHFAMFFAVFLRIVDDGGNGETYILSYSSTGYGFSIRDTLMNAQLNMILLFGRLVYRNWIALQEQKAVTARQINSQVSYIPSRRCCVSYYCTVGLRQKNSNARTSLMQSRVLSSIPSSLPRTRTSVTESTRTRTGSVISIQALESYHTPMTSVHVEGWTPSGGKTLQQMIELQNAALQRHRAHLRNLTKIQLQFAPVGQDFKAHNTMVPGFGRLLTRVLGPSTSSWSRRVLIGIHHGLGYGGMVGLVLGALAAWTSKDQNLDNRVAGLAHTQKLALGASVVFCGVFFASLQRQLLWRLYSSFNFLFLSTKLTVSSLALCQFFGLDGRVIWVWGAWLWMQWAITLDAIPPSTMRLLAFRRSPLLMFVFTIETVGLIILSLELFAWDRWIIPDHAVIDMVVFGHHVKLSTLSALASRLWTIFLWDCKLMWFLCAALWRQRQRRLTAVDIAEAIDDDEGERLLLTGRVEFFYEWAAHTRPTTARARWSRGIQILRATQSLLRFRHRNKITMLKEETSVPSDQSSRTKDIIR